MNERSLCSCLENKPLTRLIRAQRANGVCCHKKVISSTESQQPHVSSRHVSYSSTERHQLRFQSTTKGQQPRVSPASNITSVCNHVEQGTQCAHTSQKIVILTNLHLIPSILATSSGGLENKQIGAKSSVELQGERMPVIKSHKIKGFIDLE